MLQNRVDPLGALHAVAARGAWFGNRGCLHDAAGVIRRGHSGRRWITCRLQFNARPPRPPMPPGRYTGLFFLDEATAYAAGHRPCAECRHADWRRFRGLWTAEFGAASAEGVDQSLHAARLSAGQRRLSRVAASAVPEGAMILQAGAPVLRQSGRWWRWSFGGYAPVPAPPSEVDLLTPEPLARLMALGLPVQAAVPA